MTNSWVLLYRRVEILLPILLWAGFSDLSTQAQSLGWEQRSGYRQAPLRVAETATSGARAGFTRVRTEESGVRFTNTMSYARAEMNQNLMNGCGVAAGDFDGDGVADLFFANTEGSSALFRNQGNWRFENVTASAGVSCSNQASKGVVFADLNGDGWLDLVVNALGGPNACLLNLKDGRFTNVTAMAGIAAKAGGHSLALADVDGDGDLDLYMANYGELSILRSGGQFSVRTVNGRPTVAGRWAKRLKLVSNRLIELGEADVLYLNDGAGKFSPVSWTGGAFLNPEGLPLKTEPLDMGLSVLFRDINGDNAPDIYVCNDFQTPDRIWINDGRGRFRALADLSVRTLPHFSMGVDFADIDRDGHDDFFVGDMLSRRHDLRLRQVGAGNPPADEVGEVWDRHQARRNTLNVSRGDGTYADLANFAGVDASDWTWSVVFLDVDLDGYEDLLTVNAHAYDTQDLDMQERAPAAVGAGANRQIGKNLKDFPPLITPNYAFRNLGNRTFVEVGTNWGFNSTNVSHGIALADLDNDGDLDLAVSCLWQAPLIYRNESTAPRVAVRLKGRGPNTKGIGAKIRLLGGAAPVQSQEVHAGGRYLSADEPMRVFAAGKGGGAMSIEVIWRSGKVSVVQGVRANHIYEIDEAGAQTSTSPPAQARPAPIFSDVSSTLGHFHAPRSFNDAERQPLLFKSLSGLGPGVAWLDLDNDGVDELVIGGPVGGPLGLFQFEEKHSYRPRALRTPVTLTADLSGWAAWSSKPGRTELLAGRQTYRPGAEAAGSLDRLSITSSVKEPQPWLESAARDKLPGSSAGPVAVADIDGDGDLDVFVGGRVIPGRYPETPASFLLVNESGRLVPDRANNTILMKAGMVSGAVWSDLDTNGYPDLVLACEWGPVRVFENHKGRLNEVTARLGLDLFTGWWNGVTTGDIDGDGRMDIIASNWGWNSAYHRPSAQSPLRLYHGDLDENGTYDLLETEMDGARIVPRRNLNMMSAGLPGLRLKFPTHRAFSAADVTTVLGDPASRAARLEATTFGSLVFLNRGDRVIARALPDEAQYAPAFAVVVADMNGDGSEDVFLSQNYFGTFMEEPRLDAGRGLWLAGKAGGELAAVPGSESGVMIYGEQRGAAIGDYDRDGRIDLVVAQQSGEVKLFRNAGGKPGVRVRLNGPALNPFAVGAQVRLSFGESHGPMREVHAGSGYWSQDSLVQVLSTPRPPTAVEVRWPGGRVTSSAVPTGSLEVRIQPDGTLEKVR